MGTLGDLLNKQIPRGFSQKNFKLLTPNRRYNVNFSLEFSYQILNKTTIKFVGYNIFVLT